MQCLKVAGSVKWIVSSSETLNMNSAYWHKALLNVNI